TCSKRVEYKNSNFFSFELAVGLFLPASSFHSTLGISPFGLSSVWYDNAGLTFSPPFLKVTPDFENSTTLPSFNVSPLFILQLLILYNSPFVRLGKTLTILSEKSSSCVPSLLSTGKDIL